MTLIKNKWFLMALLLPYFEPGYFASLQGVHTVFQDARIIATVLIFCSYLIWAKLSPYILAVAFYYLSLLYSTIVHNGDLWQAFLSASYVVSVCMLVDMISQTDVKVIFQSLYYLLSLLIYINLVLLFVYPNGMYFTQIFNNKGNFLAPDNGLSPFLIPAIAVAVLYSRFIFKKITLGVMLLVLACCVTLIMVWCGTALVGLAIALILLFLIYKKIMSRVLNFTFYFAVYITSFIGIVIFRIQNLFSFVIIDMPHKSLTLSGRTDIWEQAFAIIKQSFWTGYGVKQYGLYVNYNGTIWEGHDQILQVMLEGGLISTIFFVLVIILCGARLMKYRKHESSRVLSAFIFVFLIMMLTEQYSDALLFFALLSMGYRIPDIIKQYNDYHLREEDKTPKYSNAVLVHKPTNRGYNPCDPNML